MNKPKLLHEQDLGGKASGSYSFVCIPPGALPALTSPRHRPSSPCCSSARCSYPPCPVQSQRPGSSQQCVQASLTWGSRSGSSVWGIGSAPVQRDVKGVRPSGALHFPLAQSDPQPGPHPKRETPELHSEESSSGVMPHTLQGGREALSPPAQLSASVSLCMLLPV